MNQLRRKRAYLINWHLIVLIPMLLSCSGDPTVKFFNGLIKVSDAKLSNVNRSLVDTDLINAEVVAIESNSTTVTDSQGRFQFVDLKDTKIRITLENGFSAVYTVDINGDVDQVEVEFFLDPVFARSSNELVLVSPSLELPGPFSEITSPQPESSLACVRFNEQSSECFLQVTGNAFEGAIPLSKTKYAYLVSRLSEPELSSYRLIGSAINVDQDSGTWTAWISLVDPAIEPVIDQEYDLIVVISSEIIPNTELMSFVDIADIPGFIGSSERVVIRLESDMPVECVQAPTGLLAWWTFDETEGEISADVLGNYNGIHINGPQPVIGLVDGALRFDGVDDFVTVPDSEEWAFGGNEFTIELWASFDTGGGGSIGRPGDVFIGSDEGSGMRNKWFFALGGNMLLFHVNGEGIASIFSPLVPFTVDVGRWYHLAVTRFGTSYIIYINGTKIDSGINSENVPNANAPLTIGQAESLGYMSGRLDEVSVYNRALSEEELSAVANTRSGGKCKVL